MGICKRCGRAVIGLCICVGLSWHGADLPHNQEKESSPERNVRVVTVGTGSSSSTASSTVSSNAVTFVIRKPSG